MSASFQSRTRRTGLAATVALANYTHAGDPEMVLPEKPRVESESLPAVLLVVGELHEIGANVTLGWWRWPLAAGSHALFQSPCRAGKIDACPAAQKNKQDPFFLRLDRHSRPSIHLETGEMIDRGLCRHGSTKIGPNAGMQQAS